MNDLIEALQIMVKYPGMADRHSPIHCEHDILTVVGLDPNIVSDEDKAKLEELSFFVSDEYGEEWFASFRFGSA